MHRVEYKIREDGNGVDEIHKAVIWRFEGFFLSEQYAQEAAVIEFTEWRKTDAGKFIENYAVDKLDYHFHPPLGDFIYKFVIQTKIQGKHLTEFYLRWGKP